MPKDTFIALDGISSNGSEYIEDAVCRGASRVVCRPGISVSSETEVIYTDDTRAYLEDILVREYGKTIESMTLIGVTGTNGKTTTCYLVSQALNALGLPCAYIGTVGFYLGSERRSLANTSVDLCDLYELLLEAHEKGFDLVALEASSQGLDMGRLNTVKFDIAAFTNLTEDHLDYHKTMENYALAKRKLFESLKPGGVCVVNADDSYKDYFLNTGNKTVTVSVAPEEDRDSTFRVTEYITVPRKETVMTFEYENSSYTVHTLLSGRHNMYDLITCIAIISCLQIELSSIESITPILKLPEGRMDRITYKGSDIIIDYAHTPDAFEKIFDTAGEFTKGKMIAVFGCTGDREREKRPVMTRIALSRCAYCILTVDDIHSEDPEQIFKDMTEGCVNSNYEIIPDRKEAIRRGIELLEEGDSLLILGKGHERSIAADGYDIPHNDRDAVLEITGEL